MGPNFDVRLEVGSNLLPTHNNKNKSSGMVSSSTRRTAIGGVAAVVVHSLLLITSCDGFISPITSIKPIHQGKYLIHTSPSTSRYNGIATYLQKGIRCGYKYHTRYKLPTSLLATAKDTQSTSLDTNTNNRPAWALPWMPTWLITLKPSIQFIKPVIFFKTYHLKFSSI